MILNGTDNNNGKSAVTDVSDFFTVRLRSLLYSHTSACAFVTQGNQTGEQDWRQWRPRFKAYYYSAFTSKCHIFGAETAVAIFSLWYVATRMRTRVYQVWCKAAILITSLRMVSIVCSRSSSASLGFCGLWRLEIFLAIRLAGCRGL